MTKMGFHQDPRRAAVFSSCWQDPKYLRLHARKDAIGKAWNFADSRGEPEAKALLQRFKAACRRISAFEDAKLRKAGLIP